MKALFCASLAMTLLLAAPVSAAGDAVKGKAVFTRCVACHTLTAAKTKPTGPHLENLFGRKAGSVEGARYSAGMKASGIVWDAASLDRYLAAPRTVVPGSSMTLAVPNATERANLIAYLAEATKPASP